MRVRVKVTADLLRKIKRLHDSGMRSAEIESYVDLSVSSIDAYVRIIDAAYGSGSFCMNPKVYNKKAVSEFCKNAGISVPENTFITQKKPDENQLSVDDIAPDMRETPAGGMIIETEDERLIWEAKAKLINCIDNITNQLTVLAKALKLMFKDND